LHPVIFVINVLAVQPLSFYSLIVTLCNSRLKSKQDRQCTHNVTLACVRVTIDEGGRHWFCKEYLLY